MEVTRRESDSIHEGEGKRVCEGYDGDDDMAVGSAAAGWLED